MSMESITIAGGGIAGLAAALALPAHDVEVLEQAPAFSETGAGLQLGPNAVRALQKLGAWDAVEPVASSPPEIHLRDGLSGQLLKRLHLGLRFEQRYGAPYRVAHRADLHKALLEVVSSRRNITLSTSRKLEAARPEGKGIALRINETWTSKRNLVAADGVNSLVRQSLFPGSDAVDSGEMFHRTLFAPPGRMDIDLTCVTLWMYPKGHVVHYPVGRAQHLNLVAVVPKQATPLQHFNRAASPLMQLLEAASTHMSPWPGLYVQPLPTWTKGSVLLLGDAAHATLPYLAQGAAMALEDAAVLSSAVEIQPDIEQAFHDTASRRVGRTKRLLEASLSAGRTYHLGGVPRLARNAALSLAPPAMLDNRLDWIYGE